jgi:hypothetical protein
MLAELMIPDHPEAITPTWLTQALRVSRTIPRAVVTSCAWEALDMSGWTTRMVRCRLTYDRPETSAPPTVVVKCSAQDTHTRQFFGRFYAREVAFYTLIAPNAPLRVPRCYYAAYDVVTCNHILLLEDITPAVTSDHLQGVDVQVVKEYTRSVAALHAQ